MGQKVNPHGLRVGIIKGWDSRWYAKSKDFGDILVEDYNIRKMLKKKLYSSGVPKIEIERDATKVRVNIHCCKPGKVIGESGKNVEIVRNEIENIVNKNKEKKTVIFVNVIEVKKQDQNAQIVAENIAGQLERRISFRRAMKQAIQRAMNIGAKGIKVAVSGRLGGAEIARTEQYHEGTIPLQTLRANIDYGFEEANTTYGKIGVKVWIYTGEVLHEKNRLEEQPKKRLERPYSHGRRQKNNAPAKKS